MRDSLYAIMLAWILYTYILFILKNHRVSADEYRIKLSTSNVRYAGTSNPVFLSIRGNEGNVSEFQVSNQELYAGKFVWFNFKKKPNIGRICGIKLRLDGDDGWYAHEVSVFNLDSGMGQIFLIGEFLDDPTDLTVTRQLPVNGGFSAYREWTPCMAACGQQATQNRTRTCSNPSPGCGGAGCQGQLMEIKSCQGQPCPTTSTMTSVSTSRTMISVSKSLRTTPGSNLDSRSISLGVVLALSLILTIILAIFLFVVLRDRHNDRKQNNAQSPVPTKSTAYSNTDAGKIYVNHAMINA